MSAHPASDPVAGIGPSTWRGYLIGFALSSVLTAAAFGIVMTGAITGQAAAFTIIALAIAQILVHTFCFLHLNTRSEGGWTLLAFIFTAVIVVITIAGSLWIMYHLNSNMMPMPQVMDGM